jgi:hypothetical protein
MRSIRSIPIVAAVLAVLFALPALAQTAAPQGTPARVRGTVVKLEDHTLTVKARDGQDVVITLADNYSVRAMARRTLADVKAGDFIGCTSVNGSDGKRHAVEIHIFPAGTKGNEGQFPWDLLPDSTMTNAIIAGVSAAPQGQVLKVSFSGKDDEVVIGDDTVIVAYVPGDASLLTPGAAVLALGLKKPDGTITAAAINAEANGVKPPM